MPARQFLWRNIAMLDNWSVVLGELLGAFVWCVPRSSSAHASGSVHFDFFG